MYGCNADLIKPQRPHCTTELTCRPCPCCQCFHYVAGRAWRWISQHCDALWCTVMHTVILLLFGEDSRAKSPLLQPFFLSFNAEAQNNKLQVLLRRSAADWYHTKSELTFAPLMQGVFDAQVSKDLVDPRWKILGLTISDLFYLCRCCCSSRTREESQAAHSHGLLAARVPQCMSEQCLEGLNAPKQRTCT